MEWKDLLALLVQLEQMDQMEQEALRVQRGINGRFFVEKTYTHVLV
jgi:hypothetical protein